MSSVRSRSTLLLALLALHGMAGCASLGSEDPPVCDGRHRRPANADGSVLMSPTTTAPALQATSASGTAMSGGCA